MLDFLVHLNQKWITVVHFKIDQRTPLVNTTVVHHNLSMTREDPQMKLRLPVELKDRLTALAERNGRSLNAEVVQRLENSLEGEAPSGMTPPIDNRTLDMLADTVAGKVVLALDERERNRKRK